MITYISILRGINVSGRNPIKMEALKDLCSTLGMTQVQTYIQSGNIVYQYKQVSTEKISALLKKEIRNTFGWEVPVITLTLEELIKTVQNNPYPKDKKKDPAFFHVTFLDQTPATENLKKILACHYSPDLFEIIDKMVYLYCPGGYGETKLSNNFFENKLKLTATTRNWKTTLQLIKMAETSHPL
jgi:uncharacterized protein (DUF1697 family)